jgi:hypothetical protein
MLNDCTVEEAPPIPKKLQRSSGYRNTFASEREIRTDVGINSAQLVFDLKGTGPGTARKESS